MFTWLPLLAIVSLIALALIVPGIKKRNPIFAANYQLEESPWPDVIETADRLLGRSIMQAFRGPRDEWLLDLAGGQNNAPALLALLYRPTNLPTEALALIRSGDNHAWAVRKSKGGVYAKLEPLQNDAQAAIAQGDWVLLGREGVAANPALLEMLSRAARLPEAKNIQGIAVWDGDLAIWSDTDSYKEFLAAVPAIRGVFEHSD